MNFELNEDQAAFLDSLRKLLGHKDDHRHLGRRSYFDGELDAALEEGGFYDALGVEGFGPVAAAMLVQEISATTAVVEAGASSFVRPLAAPEWPRPFAVVAGRIDRPARFLRQARSVIFLNESAARIREVDPGEVEALDPFFTYPMARLKDPERFFASAEELSDARNVRRLLLVAAACEIGGALHGALNSVVDHVKNRRQFGRPLGSFQAVQHRLAMGAATAAAGNWLSRKAAATGEMKDALFAAGYLQDAAPRLLYDFHQFMGAMGLTLEHPLYSWSYRIKLLISEFGGASRQLRDVAAAAWPAGAECA